MTPTEATREETAYAGVENPCKLCSPLGASLVFRGIEGAVGLLHGSQGCSTYIRRYLISHFKEPVDIASSNFSEETAVFGGGQNLHGALDNVIAQYHPRLVGVASTCLSETIGEDVPKLLREYQSGRAAGEVPPLVSVSTPSYRGTHMEGFWGATLAVVQQLARKHGKTDRVNIFPGLVSAEDLRYLKQVCLDFGIHPVILPDYSQTLDGPAWEKYQLLPPGGTPVLDIADMGSQAASLEFSSVLDPAGSPGRHLESQFEVPWYRMGLPVGMQASDRFFKTLSLIANRPVPESHREARGRLLDAYADAHKHVFEVPVAIYGEEDWVAALAAFACEIGMRPVLCASGGKSSRLRPALEELIPDFHAREVRVLEGVDFAGIGGHLEELKPELLVGNSKGYSLARKLGIPLARAGFPIHDRFGGQRLLHVGYHGALRLFDQWVNAVIERKQEQSPIGYTYM